MKIKVMALILTIVSILSCFTICATAVEATDFVDVPTTHWAYKNIKEMSFKGIVNGVGGNMFNPDGNVTTAQFIAMMVRTFYPEQLKAEEASIGHTTWYSAAMKVAFDNNLLMLLPSYFTYYNYENVHYWRDDHVNNNMTREFMAQVIYNYLVDKFYLDTSTNREETFSKIPDLYDKENGIYNSPNTYDGTFESMRRLNSIVSIYHVGILKGVDDAGTFNKDGIMTRAQACAVISRTLEYIENPTVKYNKFLFKNQLENEQNFRDKCQAVRVDRLADGSIPTVENITRLINTVREKFPTGTEWDADNIYNNDEVYNKYAEMYANGVSVPFGFGSINAIECAAFVYEVLEAIYGADFLRLPYGSRCGIRIICDYDYNKEVVENFEFMPGDYIVDATHHYVIVAVDGDNVKIAEGNYFGQVNWDREIPISEVKSSAVQIFRALNYFVPAQ